MKLTIFAEKNTTNRFFIACQHKEEIREVQLWLGNNWVQVQELEIGQGILFQSNETYYGFDGRKGADFCYPAVTFEPKESEDLSEQIETWKRVLNQ